MPQLDSVFFLGESIITIILLYSTIYFYLFWFSKQNFESWIVSARLNYYFEQQLFYLFFLNTTVTTLVNSELKFFFEYYSVVDSWIDQFVVLNAME